MTPNKSSKQNPKNGKVAPLPPLAGLEVAAAEETQATDSGGRLLGPLVSSHGVKEYTFVTTKPIGWAIDQATLEVLEVGAGSQAGDAGVQIGSKVASVGGVEISSVQALMEAISEVRSTAEEGGGNSELRMGLVPPRRFRKLVSVQL